MIKQRTLDRETRFCPWCNRDKPIGEFYTRKKGAQAGLPTAYCKVCNTEAIRYRALLTRARNGTIDAYMESLRQQLRQAERAKKEIRDKGREKLALEIGLKILDERDKESEK